MHPRVHDPRAAHARSLGSERHRSLERLSGEGESALAFQRRKNGEIGGGGLGRDLFCFGEFHRRRDTLVRRNDGFTPDRIELPQRERRQFEFLGSGRISAHEIHHKRRLARWGAGKTHTQGVAIQPPIREALALHGLDIESGRYSDRGGKQIVPFRIEMHQGDQFDFSAVHLIDIVHARLVLERGEAESVCRTGRCRCSRSAIRIGSGKVHARYAFVVPDNLAEPGGGLRREFNAILAFESHFVLHPLGRRPNGWSPAVRRQPGSGAFASDIEVEYVPDRFVEDDLQELRLRFLRELP